MKTLKISAIVLGAYLVIVFAFEIFVVVMGSNHAETGVQAGETWITITTSDAEGSYDTVLGYVEFEGSLYVATNHWPRGWYHRAVANPEIVVSLKGVAQNSRAIPVTGAERTRVAAYYTFPFIVRLLTGFPPRSFLQLSPE